MICRFHVQDCNHEAAERRGTVKPSQPTHTLYCSMQRVIKLADPNFLFEHIQPTPVCCYSDRLLTSIYAFFSSSSYSCLPLPLGQRVKGQTGECPVPSRAHYTSLETEREQASLCDTVGQRQTDMRDGGGGEERRWTPLKLWLEEERKSAVTKGERWEGAFAYETATWEKHRGTFDSVVFKCNIKMPQRAHAQSYPLCKVTSRCFESPSRGKSRCSAAFVVTLLSSYFEAFIKWMRREAFEKTKNTTKHNTMA